MAGRKSPKVGRGCRIAVDADERRRLIEDCAFFRGERFREIQPGEVREQDRAAAAADVDAAIGGPRKRRGKR
ncbi:hypothetical protein D3C83_18300 [compost metagenome]